MTVTQMPTSEEITQRWVATTIKTVMASIEVDPGELLNGWSGKVLRPVTHEYQAVRPLYDLAA